MPFVSSRPSLYSGFGLVGSLPQHATGPQHSLRHGEEESRRQQEQIQWEAQKSTRETDTLMEEYENAKASPLREGQQKEEFDRERAEVSRAKAALEQQKKDIEKQQADLAALTLLARQRSEEMEQRKEEMKKQQVVLSRAVAVAEWQGKELKEQWAKAKAWEVSLEVGKEELEKRGGGLKQELDAAVERKRELEVERTGLAAMALQEEKRKKKLKEQWVVLNQARAAVQEEAQELQAEREGLTATTLQAQQQEDELRSRAVELEKQQAELATQALLLEQRREEVNKQQVMLSQAVAEVERQGKELEEQWAKVKARELSTEAQKKELEKWEEALQQERDKLVRTKKELEAERVDLAAMALQEEKQRGNLNERRLEWQQLLGLLDQRNRQEQEAEVEKRLEQLRQQEQQQGQEQQEDMEGEELFRFSEDAFDSSLPLTTSSRPPCIVSTNQEEKTFFATHTRGLDDGRLNCTYNSCGKELSHEGMLHHQRREHTGYKLHDCPVELCAMFFTKPKEVASHACTHTNTKTNFTKPKEVASHACTHTNTKKFGCLARECDVQYEHKRDRDQHVSRDHHGEGDLLTEKQAEKRQEERHQQGLQELRQQKQRHAEELAALHRVFIPIPPEHKKELKQAFLGQFQVDWAGRTGVQATGIDWVEFFGIPGAPFVVSPRGDVGLLAERLATQGIVEGTAIYAALKAQVDSGKYGLSYECMVVRWVDLPKGVQARLERQVLIHGHWGILYLKGHKCVVLNLQDERLLSAFRLATDQGELKDDFRTLGQIYFLNIVLYILLPFTSDLRLCPVSLDAEWTLTCDLGLSVTKKSWLTGFLTWIAMKHSHLLGDRKISGTCVPDLVHSVCSGMGGACHVFCPDLQGGVLLTRWTHNLVSFIHRRCNAPLPLELVVRDGPGIKAEDIMGESALIYNPLGERCVRCDTGEQGGCPVHGARCKCDNVAVHGGHRCKMWCGAMDMRCRTCSRECHVPSCVTNWGYLRKLALAFGRGWEGVRVTVQQTYKIIVG